MEKFIKLTPFLSERLWGDQRLKNFGFELPENVKIGEAWVISALDEGVSSVSKESEFYGLTLKQLFEQHRKLFNDITSTYPMLSKIISADDYLSVQVHPDDQYALKHNNMLGKPECWYIIDLPENAEMIYGHYAKTQDELIEMVDNGKWNQLLKKVNIKKGDFLYVPPGKIHAITPGVILFELQRSSDVTYRFYDFDRVDKNGLKRPLHLKESFDVTTVPDNDIAIINIDNGILIDNEYFTLHLINNIAEKTYQFKKVNWMQITVVEGNGTINLQQFKQGESAIIPYGIDTLRVKGEIKFLLSYQR